MTNEQLTQEFIKLAENQAKYEAKCVSDKENIFKIIEEMKNDIKSTKSLAEDVHIMAINMKSMQETLKNTTKKVDAISSQEFLEYKENKKAIKKNIISVFGGAIGTGLLALIIWFIDKFMKGGV